MRGSLIFAAGWLACSGPLAAQTEESLPDPATITVPDTSANDPEVLKEGYKFFYFNNPAVSFAEAVADIAECRSFLASGAAPSVPGFIPWTEPVQRKQVRGGGFMSMYGLVGVGVSAGLAAIIMPKIERGKRNNKLRRCMEPRGYKRFALPEASWKVLNEGDEKQLVLMQAKLASAPQPAKGEVTE